MKINTITITGKTHKANNRIREGLTNNIVILRKSDSVIALGGEPGFLIAPAHEPTVDSRHTRWIRAKNDKDFSITGE